MVDFVTTAPLKHMPTRQTGVAAKLTNDPQTPDIGKQFEQMLWAEMLTHSGLEKAFTQNGGEGVAAFSRYIVEAIAKDIAEKHPLGLSSSANTQPSAPPALVPQNPASQPADNTDVTLPAFEGLEYE